MTDTEKLTALLNLTTALTTALKQSESLTRTHEEQLAYVKQRQPRLDNIAAFFSPIFEIVRRAEAQVRRISLQAQRAEQRGAHFYWLGGEENKFCHAWEGVCHGYSEVERVEWSAGLAGGSGKGKGRVVEEAVFDGYLQTLGAFGVRLKGFDDEYEEYLARKVRWKR